MDSDSLQMMRLSLLSRSQKIQRGSVCPKANKLVRGQRIATSIGPMSLSQTGPSGRIFNFSWRIVHPSIYHVRLFWTGIKLLVMLPCLGNPIDQWGRMQADTFRHTNGSCNRKNGSNFNQKQWIWIIWQMLLMMLGLGSWWVWIETSWKTFRSLELLGTMGCDQIMEGNVSALNHTPIQPHLVGHLRVVLRHLVPLWAAHQYGKSEIGLVLYYCNCQDHIGTS